MQAQPQSPEPQSEPQVQPQNSPDPKPCNLVMKGAIASGVVYPPAVLLLKDTYRFQQIGGTSSGSIAAIATAAAEYNRACTGTDQGFQYFEALSRTLSGDNQLADTLHLSPKVQLRDLFQASPDTQPLLDMLNPLIDLTPQNAGASTAVTGNKNTNLPPPGSPAQNIAQQGAPAQNTSSAPSPQTNVPSDLSLFLQLIQNLFSALPQTIFQFASILLPVWAQTNPSFKKGQSTGTWWGAIIGLGLALLLALAIVGIIALFLPAGTFIRNLSIFLVVFVLIGIVFAVLVGWFGKWTLGIIAGFINAFDILSNKVPQNFYGICTGHSNSSDLTDWLGHHLDQIAGIRAGEDPLTFGDLADKNIELRMVTSNLSHNQPYILPKGLQNFLFKEEDMLKLFPKPVVQYMIQNAPLSGLSGLIPKEKLPQGYYFLPDWKNLPVIFGARLSISFPLLISAVPLYTISSAFVADENANPAILNPQADLQQNWFSDGGICSNFPIDFFDNWLPSHPTFGINLTSMRKPTDFSALDAAVLHGQPRPQRNFPTQASPKEGVKPVYLPQANDLQDPEWESVSGLASFLQSIISTGLYYHNLQQANLPSYRERVVQIRMEQDEGGLRINMPPETIQRIVDKGRQAGEKLLNEFDFDHHWWVRFLVLMSQLVPNLVGVQAALSNPTIDQRFKNQISASPPYPYPRDLIWCDKVELHVKALLDLITSVQDSQMTQGSDIFEKDAPMPKPILRMTAEL
jgi:predicted acylesterase/phospholipase RssA